MFTSQVLIVPGLGNSNEGHWQTYWEKLYDFKRVEQLNWNEPVMQDWVKKLDEEVMKYDPAEVILVGHSLACATIAWWNSTYNKIIKGVLLVAPADTEAVDFPPEAKGFAPMPMQKLPFPSIVVSSSNDKYVTLERARFLADCWGSRFINIGKVGHINSESNMQEWQFGLGLLAELNGKVD